METLIVIAPAGRTCPMELSRVLITDSQSVTVPNNPYYRRLIAEGSLLAQNSQRSAEKTDKRRSK